MLLDSSQITSIVVNDLLCHTDPLTAHSMLWEGQLCYTAIFQKYTLVICFFLTPVFHTLWDVLQLLKHKKIRVYKAAMNRCTLSRGGKMKSLFSVYHPYWCIAYSDNASRPAAEAQIVISQVVTFGKAKRFSAIEGQILLCAQSDLKERIINIYAK